MAFCYISLIFINANLETTENVHISAAFCIELKSLNINQIHTIELTKIKLIQCYTADKWKKYKSQTKRVAHSKQYVNME